MDRRAFLAGTGAVLLAAPLAAEGQQARKLAQIGWLGLTTRAGNTDLLSGFREGLQHAGYAEGKNIAIELRFADGRAERLPGLAAELVDLPADVIVVTSSQAAAAAKRATMTIPIVMMSVGAAADLGLIASLARPGGNITGVASAHQDFAAKWLQLLYEAVPKAARIGYLEDLSSNAPVTQILLKEILVAGRTLGVSVQTFSVPTPDAVASQLVAMARARVQGVVVGPTPVPRTRQKEIVEFVAKNRLPAIYGGRDYVDAGGLMSYNPNRPDMGRQAAAYVDKILKGAKPADLPVEEPTKFELVINLKTAKALGLTIPPSLLGRADEVIQ
jgi:putative tryptophan/tyrosine transport system substrate-binding protein